MKRMSLLSSIFRSGREDVQEKERRSSENSGRFQRQEDLLIRSAISTHEDHFESSSQGYVHSAISPKLQHPISDSFMKREEEGVGLLGAFLMEISPLDEGSSSQEEGMKNSPSIDDKDPRSLIDGG